MTRSVEASTPGIDRDFREAREAAAIAHDMLRAQDVDVLALLKFAYELGFIAGLRHERTRKAP